MSYIKIIHCLITINNNITIWFKKFEWIFGGAFLNIENNSSLKFVITNKVIHVIRVDDVKKLNRKNNFSWLLVCWRKTKTYPYYRFTNYLNVNGVRLQSNCCRSPAGIRLGTIRKETKSRFMYTQQQQQSTVWLVGQHRYLVKE